jgi:sugar lactone lactonase YvrE
MVSGKVEFHLPVNVIGTRPALASAKNLVALPFSKAIPGGAEGRVGVWSLETGEQIQQLKVPWPAVSSTALSPDGETLVCGRSNYDNTAQPPGNVLEITAWIVASGKEKFSFKMPAATLGGMTFSPDGRELVVGVQSGLLWVSDTDSGAGRKLIQVPNNGIVMGTPVFAPDGRSFAVVRQHAKPEGLEYRIEIWETASRTLRREFTGHKANVNAVAFSPDGSTLASGSSDTTSLLWDLWAAADPKAAVKLEAKELTQLWDTLNSPNADSAWEAQQRLALGRDTSLPYLGEHLQAAGGAEPPSKEQIAQWIKQLDDDNVDTREKAGTRLLEAGRAARDALTKALDGNPSAEASQRIKQILDKLADGDQASAILQPLRALEVLQHIGTPEAKEIVKKLADGKADTALTVAAKESLKRWR